MPKTHSRQLIALLAVIALMAAACGGSETTGTAAPSDEVSDVTQATSSEDEPTEDATDAVTEEASASEDAPEITDSGSLKLAYLLPETGQLAFLGPPIIGGFQLAIQQINEAGGTNGAEVFADGGDEGDGDGTIANQTADRLLADGTHAIVGAASSGISLTVIDKVTGAGVAMCSPSNTSPTFTNYDDSDLYFRAAPTDALQGPVLAEQIVAAGGTNVAILARADDYGQGLLDATVAALGDAGATVAVETTYDPMAQSFDAEVQQVVDSGANTVALIAFDEGARILQTMIERGIGPADLIVFGADGLNSGDLPSLVDPEDPLVLTGMGVTAPATSSSADFQSTLQEFAPELEDFGFAAEAYDCAIAFALAAHQGGANTSEAIAENMVSVTTGGTKCTSYAECIELIDAGEDIDYDGASGPMDFTDAGEPSVGTYDVKEFDDAGELTTLETITSTS
ncbi:MAG: ABC transporter substrate-binding protein [Euzebya sp.]